MKTYKVVLAVFENGETYPDVMDLVNVEDPDDRIMCATDEFVVGEIVTENDFFMQDSQYVDEESFGVAPFAFKNMTEQEICTEF